MTRWLELLEGTLSAQNIEILRKEAARGANLTKFAVEENIVPVDVLLGAMAKHYRLPILELDFYHPDGNALKKVPEAVARRFQVLPLFQLNDRLYLSLCDPDDLMAQDYLRQLTGLTVEPVLSSPGDIERAINRHYLTKEKSAEAMSAFTSQRVDSMRDEHSIRFEDSDAPAIKLVSYILTQAVKMGASDVHLEPYLTHVTLRYRVDGVLHEFPPPPLHLFRSLVSRVKIISNLDVAEKRLPQDGRASLTVEGRDYDLRISIIPNLHGEGIVIRILDTHGKNLDLLDLGFDGETRERYMHIVSRPYGILLVTGPTGSGKTTTLYATLKSIYTPKKKIVTVEDPVEYQLDGITQIQVQPDIDFTFARGLRSILRHDPDIIMLGEIRDLESAEIAIRASLTGHLVFSTIHTNNAPQTVTRLLDMGIPSYLVLASLIGILSQRLIRRLCHECRQSYEGDEKALASLGVKELPPGATLYSPVGCSACGGLGYRGRVGIFELLEITPQLRRLPQAELEPERIREIAAPQGYRSLRELALQALFAGETAVEEILSLATE